MSYITAFRAHLPSAKLSFQKCRDMFSEGNYAYSGRTKYSAFVSKLNKLAEEYLSPQKTQKAAVFFIRKILDL
jgi:hypothetical protein